MVWNPGQQLFGDRYVIERKLGEGGVGITYLAKNRRGELRVLKTLREQILNHPAWISKQDKLCQDFRYEALRLALCRHPYIVQVENVFDEDNLPCMAMEYIEGEDLGELITEKGALSEVEALLYIRQIGDALTVVHDRGLLHRDLKPSNIMMRAGKQEAVLIDFGIARPFIPGGVKQHTQNLTPGYAPPEQYIPDAEQGEYIDVYALAATLYSLLTGQLPMPAPARLQNITMRSPKDLNSNVSDRVNEAVMRGMALNYKFRPQSVQEWLDLLGAGINEKKQQLIIPNSTSQNQQSLPSVTENYTEIYTLTRLKWLASVAFSPDGEMLASGSWDNTIKLWNWEIGNQIRTFKGHSHKVTSIAFSPDGFTLASGSCDKTIKLWDCKVKKFRLSGILAQLGASPLAPMEVGWLLEILTEISKYGIIIFKTDRDYLGQTQTLHAYLQDIKSQSSAWAVTLQNRLIRVKKQNQPKSSRQVFIIQEYPR